MKIIFMGTPHFAENVLEKLINSRHQVVAVVCQPDKLVGRKQILECPPTKLLAQKYNIPVYQFAKIRLEGVEPLKKIDADIMVTSAYGQILSQEILDITKYGVYNVHGSVLPKYRGSSPIQWSLINGEKTLGVTILKTQAGMDDGPILHTQEFDIQETDTVSSLMEKISLMGADLLLKSLDEIENGTAVLVKQDEAQATKCTMLKKENAGIDFNLPAQNIVNFVRGMEEWPVAFCHLNGVMLKIYKAKAKTLEELCLGLDSQISLDEISSMPVGTVIYSGKKGIFVKCNNSAVELLELQLEGGKKMSAKDFANGKKIQAGMMLN